jgi:outer membrane murein-binding lipoprotein Lpp
MSIHIVLLIAFFAALSGTAIGFGIASIISAFRNLNAKIDRLEQSSKQRNPYRTNDALEDAMAIVHDTVWQADATLDYVRARMRQVDRTLQIARNDPDSYDTEAPNKKRVVL